VIQDEAAVNTDELLNAIKAHPKIVASVFYGCCPSEKAPVPVLAHLPGSNAAREGTGAKVYSYPGAADCFTIPAHANYRASAAAVSHTRTLSFLKPLMGGPYFDLEAIWDEHTRYEFADRSVEATMATMVDEPYVNHVPTLTGGIGRASLTRFYRDHFIFSNPDDATLELVSRTVGIDRIVDEFLFNCTHDRVIDWLYGSLECLLLSEC
jgi:carboxymethylenebutenolidase